MPLFLLAPDSLKGSLSATDACIALEQGARRACAEHETLSEALEVISVPLADGGEGTVAAMAGSLSAETLQEAVRGPLGAEVAATWAKAGDAAIIEMAQSSGLTLVAPEARDALSASSFGTGQVVAAALRAGCRELLIGIGGSATTDGGAGALQALGARFLDDAGNELPPGGAALHRLASIDLGELDPVLAEAKIRILCDVTNPLCGPAGAAAVYGPQKGASPQQVAQLDAALSHYADIVSHSVGRDCRDTPGAGAAGGMGFGLISFTNAELVPGIAAVLEATGFAGLLERADLVLTAEGSIDSQTPHGKALAGVALAARAARGGRGVPVIAFGGTVKLSGSELARMGIVAALPIPNAPQTLEECVGRAAELLGDAAERAVRIWLSGQATSA